MKKLFLVAVLASGVFSYSPVLDADEPQLSATVDKHTARVNEEIHLNVKVTGARGSLQAPHLPSLEQFEIFYSGRSSRFSFVNGRSESMTEFNYVLIPRSAGRFVVQPIEIRIDDKLYQTNQLEIQIEESQFAAQPTAVGTSPVPPRQFPSVSTSPVPPTGRLSAPTAASSGVSDGEIDQNIFLRAIPTQTSVFTNEQLVLTYSLYTRYDTRYEGFVEEPETSGFWIEEFPMEQNLGRDTEMIDGKKYVRADVKKLALFPTAPGEYVIKPGVAKTSVQVEDRSSSMFDEFFSDSFFGGAGLFARRVEKLLSPAPIRILVKPLPETGKPSSFQGAVGDFRMGTSVDKRVVNQNEAVTLQIALEGQGNIETLVPPKIPEMDHVKIYEADTQTQLFRAQNLIAGKKTFEMVIIPTEPGELKIPSLEFSFFNPKIERYVVLKSDAYKVKVNPSNLPSPVIPKGLLPGELGEAKKSIRSESEDIQYIKERLSVPSRPMVPIIVVWLFVMNGLLTAACVAVGILRKRSAYLDQNISLKRMLQARKLAAQGIKRLDRLARSTASGADGDEAFFEESAKVLDQYLSDKLNLSPLALTQELVERELEGRGIQVATIQKIREHYEWCNQVRFAKFNMGNAARELTVERLKEIVKELEGK